LPRKKKERKKKGKRKKKKKKNGEEKKKKKKRKKNPFAYTLGTGRKYFMFLARAYYFPRSGRYEKPY